MGIINISERDIKRGTLVKPNYFLVEIQNVSESQSKDGQSINYLIEEGEILQDEFGDKEFAGVPTPRWSFNSKAPGFMIPFYEAITGEKITAATNFRFDNEFLRGKKLFVFIAPKTLDDGRTVNELKNQYK